MSRDESPQRATRHTTPPIGFRRSCCPLGHACSNARCYQSITNPKILWDQAKYKKPFYPHKDKKHKHKKHSTPSPSPVGGEEANRSPINSSQDSEGTAFRKYLETNKKTGRHARARRHNRQVQKEIRNSGRGRMESLKAAGMLIPGTEEYNKKIAELKEQGKLPE